MEFAGQPGRGRGIPSYTSKSSSLSHRNGHRPVADVITHTIELGSSGERLVPQLNSEAWERVGFPASLLPDTLGQVERQLHDATEMMLQDNK